MSNVFSKIETSFKASLKGEESILALIYWWGILGYIVAFFLNKLIRSLHVYIFGAGISAVLVCYFVWHIYALKKCSPKKVKLTKEEKQKIRAEKRKELPKKLMRKLLLQESFTKWDPVFVTMVIDAYCIAQFVDYIIR